mmetsp:Transcript_5998/g.9079  ORF Transcript_5998/g.9079 Transcript_5998/m.9079 type:complete len:132 (-) Transcript_5998:272-667(-)
MEENAKLWNEIARSKWYTETVYCLIFTHQDEYVENPPKQFPSYFDFEPAGDRNDIQFIKDHFLEIGKKHRENGRLHTFVPDSLFHLEQTEALVDLLCHLGGEDLGQEIHLDGNGNCDIGYCVTMGSTIKRA